MTVSPIRLSKSQIAYDWIRQRIKSAQFSPGYRLVLSTVAAELGMSVVPVREAIRQLEAEGLVTYEHNVGARVSLADEAGYQTSMQTLSLIEAAATALAARHLSAADLRRAHELSERMAAELDPVDPYSFTALNQRFHATLYTPCPNPRLLELVEAEWTRLGNLRATIFAFVPERARKSVDEHGQLLELIERSAPPSEIEQLVRRHRAGTLSAFLAYSHPDRSVELPEL